ncbi:PEP-CTERM sorting domain-containing protein [Hydrogenophaga sp.]|uniref:PEP-CTERM sorting domain-containing protein n=1 Tax=Hydrogenophaga sp. TaxID=1904254 RepID=UPI0027309700|nr:PEP-CTERM sorting domain-containing protein [Hydrogenophaga sp.]MDP2016640.1 PEP-CTERM sorting domain-containing protein [Hydrogenophaga sp.]MDP3165817.1 PEP-CTERM sorting domain-containing protein [Hydrogenophaga sp.]
MLQKFFRSSIFLKIIAFVSFVALSSNATAGPVVDQQNLGGTLGFGDVSNVVTRAQSFQVGVSGLLAAVQIAVIRKPEASSTPGDNLLFDLYKGGISGIGLPSLNNDWLARVNIGPDMVTPLPDLLISTDQPFDTVLVNLRPFDLTVAAGDSYVFALWSPTEVHRGYEVQVNIRGYDDGGAYLLAPDLGISEWRSEVDNFDLIFQTFVEKPPSSVPEPGSLLLLGLGFCGLVVARRFQNSATHVQCGEQL